MAYNNNKKHKKYKNKAQNTCKRHTKPVSLYNKNNNGDGKPNTKAMLRTTKNAQQIMGIMAELLYDANWEIEKAKAKGNQELVEDRITERNSIQNVINAIL